MLDTDTASLCLSRLSGSTHARVPHGVLSPTRQSNAGNSLDAGPRSAGHDRHGAPVKSVSPEPSSTRVTGVGTWSVSVTSTRRPGAVQSARPTRAVAPAHRRNPRRTPTPTPTSTGFESRHHGARQVGGTRAPAGQSCPISLMLVLPFATPSPSSPLRSATMGQSDTRTVSMSRKSSISVPSCVQCISGASEKYSQLSQ